MGSPDYTDFKNDYTGFLIIIIFLINVILVLICVIKRFLDFFRNLSKK